MTNHEIMQKADSYSIKLSPEGIASIRYVIKAYGNFAYDEGNVEKFGYNDQGFCSAGYMYLELPANLTRSGNPYAYELDVESDYIIEQINTNN